MAKKTARTSKGKIKPRERKEQNRVKATNGVPTGKPPKNDPMRLLRITAGKPRSYTPDELLVVANEYFEWVRVNPLYEEKAFSTRNGIRIRKVAKMRAMSMTAFCLFAGVSDSYIRMLKSDGKEDYFTVIKFIEGTVYNQKFEGASADLLNANIISRDLGLKERIDNTSDDKPIPNPSINIYNNAPPMASDEKEIDAKKTIVVSDPQPPTQKRGG